MIQMRKMHKGRMITLINYMTILYHCKFTLVNHIPLKIIFFSTIFAVIADRNLEDMASRLSFHTSFEDAIPN